MQIHRTIESVRDALASARGRGAVGLVPTMGALHAGHAALLDRGRRECSTLILSLFVNPAQFNVAADLEQYPRDEAADAALATAHGVDVLFAPSVDEMYPSGFVTWVDLDGPARGLEGAHRPGHFRGVATVCVKLFTIVQPQIAYFGQKDAQQVAVVRRVASDLNLPLEIRVIPTVRDADGLACSSRNVRLSPAERTQALAIPRALEAGLAAFRAGGDPAAAARGVLESAPPEGPRVEYVAVADFDGQPTLAIAATVGRTRLIDNVPLTGGAELG